MKFTIPFIASALLLALFAVAPTHDASADSTWTSSTAHLTDGTGNCLWQGHLRENAGSGAESETTEDNGGNLCTKTYARLAYMPVGSSTVSYIEQYNYSGPYVRANKPGSNEAIQGRTCMSWSGWYCLNHVPPYWY